jgi:hypothetical protein
MLLFDHSQAERKKKRVRLRATRREDTYPPRPRRVLFWNVPRRKGGKICIRLRTAQRENAALHTAHLESQSEGWFDRGRLDHQKDGS